MKVSKSKFWDQSLLLITGLVAFFLIWGFWQLTGMVGMQVLLIIALGGALYHWLRDPGPWPRLAKPGQRTYAKWSTKYWVIVGLVTVALLGSVANLAVKLL
jgi:hypothetical protein